MQTDIRTIPLTQGKFATVDAEDYDWLMQWNWHAQKKKTTYGCRFYAIRHLGGQYDGTLSMHRALAQRAGLPFSEQYDHWDGDGLNNRRCNIRPCTQLQNRANSRKSTGKTSRYKGVCWHPFPNGGGRWVAELDNVYLGSFKIEEEAARVYASALREKYGEFAYTPGV